MPDELRKAAHDPHFEGWRRNSVFPHKVQGYAIVTVSLKPVGGPPGDATADQMDTLADLADKYSFGEIRVGHEQNLALPHVARRDLPALWRALDKIGLATPNVNLVSDIIACPGLDYCALANARAIPIAQDIARRFADPDLAEDVGELRIKISGCINACGHHHVGHIGILGVDKKGEEYYQITLGGSLAPDEAPETIAADLPRLEVLALTFPKFRDGRAYSHARVARERLGFTGELRAVGDVILEMGRILARCGFDAVEPSDGTTA